MINSKLLKYLTIIVTVILHSCVEEINLTNEAPLESVLVVEATITNELKTQEIYLSRSYALETEGPLIENNATIDLENSEGTVISFQQGEDGIYYSTIDFAAEPNTSYTLNIQTSDGRQYQSTAMVLTTNTAIGDVYIERGFNENNEEGISIFVDAFDPTGTSRFYRYTYEETYKIIAPFWVPQDLVLVSENPLAFEFQFKQEEQRVCFNTVNSTEILLENTNSFVDDRVERFRVRFISRNNYIMSHRYSILVKQFIQSAEAHQFYNTLKELSNEDNIFSNIQPGFLTGNISSTINPSELVAGFFEVVSSDSQRVYFNYEDEFPDEPLPPYVSNCGLSAPEFLTPGGTSPLKDAISSGFKYFSENDGSVPLALGPYFLVEPFCGNCTVLGTNIVPDFWED